MSSRRKIDVFVGWKVQIQRTLMSMSRAELAGAIGISVAQLEAYESGTQRFPASVLVEAATHLKQELSQLFRGAEELDHSPLESDFLEDDTPELRAQQEKDMLFAFSGLSASARLHVISYIRLLLNEN